MSRRRESAVGDLVQPDLFGEAEGAPRARAKRRGKPRAGDQPLLALVAHFGVLTTHQALSQLYTARGRSPVYGYRLISELRDLGLLTSEPVFPAKGASSVHYLRLTRAGWAFLGQRPTAADLRALPAAKLHYNLQRAETLLVRIQEGWSEVKAERGFTVFLRWALSSYRDRLLNDHEIVQRSMLERLPESRLPMGLLLHQKQGSVRLMLPACEGENPLRYLRGMPDLALFPTVPFEIIAPDIDLERGAREALARHASRAKWEITVHTAQRFFDRPAPRR